MIIKLIGTIVHVGDKKSGVSARGNNWVSQDFVLEETNPNVQNPNRVAFSVFGEEAIQFYNFQLGQNVSVDCVLSSKQWEKGYFTSLRAMQPAVSTQTRQYNQYSQGYQQPQAQPQPQQQQQCYSYGGQTARVQQPTPQPQGQYDVNPDDLPF